MGNRKSRASVGLTTFVIVTSIYLLVVYEDKDREYLINKLPSRSDSVFDGMNDSETIKVLAKLIHKAKIHVRGSKTSAYLGLATIEINKLLHRINVEPETLYTRSTKETNDVCNDESEVGNYSFPSLHILRRDCSHSVPLSKLITVIKYFQFNSSDFTFEAVDRFISSANFHLPHVSVLISTNSKLLGNSMEYRHRKQRIIYNGNFSEGIALNKMISVVNTQYVLVGRGVEVFTNDSRLDRLVAEIESLDVEVAGGSYRFQNGHWKKGCFQVLYRNYTLNYYEGYDESLHECLFCDYIQGPFVTQTAYSVKNKFEDLNENNGLYEDWFLRVFQKGENSIVCPDSMFHTMARSHLLFNFVKFMRKWNLNKIFLAEGFKVHLNSKSLHKIWNKIQIQSPSNLKKGSDAITVIMHSCLEAGVVCELQEGTALGAVKLGKMLPWDIDFDIRFVANNCSRCRKLANVFRKRGINFGNFVKPCCSRNRKSKKSVYVSVRYNGFRGDFSGCSTLDSALLLEENIEPTKILFDGVWLNVPRNPGLFVRNRYGREIYQHAQHWRVLGMKKFTENYIPNMFLPCRRPGSHNCLDRYNADGNMQFFDLLP